MNRRSSPAPIRGRALAEKKMKAVLSQGKRMEREYESRTRPPRCGGRLFWRAFLREYLCLRVRWCWISGSPSFMRGSGSWPGICACGSPAGKRWGITGANGREKPLCCAGSPPSFFPRQDIRAGYMPQDYGELMDTALTPVEFLAYCLERRGSREETEHQWKTRIRTFLGSFRYTPEEMDHPASDSVRGGKRPAFADPPDFGGGQRAASG